MEEGYKPVFDEAVRVASTVDYSEYFPKWREHTELFHFIMANPRDRAGSDTDALETAAVLDGPLFRRLVAKGPNNLGGSINHIDVIESRHILMMTYLYSKIGADWGNVVEFGGGYGNCFRLMHDQIYYHSWNIVDLEHVLDLQQWMFLEGGIYSDVVTFNTTVPDVVPTVVLGSHSLSEFSWDDFATYYEYIKQTRWLFYVSHSSAPDWNLLQKKMELISKDFALFDKRVYEGGVSTMYLFRSLTY